MTTRPTHAPTRRAACAALLMLPWLGAHAQAYPARPIRLVVPYAAGGATDMLARIVGEGMAKELGQPVIVENQPGANGLIGSNAVKRAAPDGYTVLFTLTSIVQNPLLNAKAGYDAFKDFVPVSEVARMPIVFSVSATLPVKTLDDLVRLARAKPGQYSYASYGNGSSAHLYAEVFQETAGIELVHVPYKGEAPAITDLIGGVVHAAFVSARGVGPHIASGKVRALAAIGTGPAPLLPEVPTFRDQGYVGLELVPWFGMFMPAGTPRAIVDAVSLAVAKTMKDPAQARRVGELGAIPKGSGPGEFAASVKAEHERWDKVIRDKKISLD